MNIETWYFAFYRAKWLRAFQRDISVYSMLGHVEAFGYTIDDTWIFIDPRHGHTGITVTHHHDAVEKLMAERFILSDQILRMPAQDPKIRNPIRGPLTCVSQCAALVGMRAYTPVGFKRKLLKNGAEVIHGGTTQGKLGRSQSAGIGAPADQSRAQPGNRGKRPQPDQ